MDAVQTRAQKLRYCRTTELHVPDAISSVDMNRISKGQQQMIL